MMEGKYGTDQLIDDIFSIIPIFNKKVFKTSDQLLKNKEVSSAHIKVMFILRKTKTSTMTYLGRVLSVSKPNVTTLIDRLVELNFCKRNLDSKDRRIVLVELTERGKEFLDNHVAELKDIFKKGLVDFNEQDIELFEETLKNMKILIEKFKEEE